MWWWEFGIIAGLLLFGIYVFVMGTGYLTMVLSHGKEPAADSMHDGGTRSRELTAIHPYAPGETAAHHSGGPVDRAA